MYEGLPNLHGSSFQVENTSSGSRMGTVRIFLAPKLDERYQPWLLIDQKNLFIELDRFVVTRKSQQLEAPN